MPISARAPVTVVVLTFNEERNLAACLDSVTGWTTAVIVVDSGSTDGTIAIAERYGARIVTHPFQTHAAQWRWAMDNLPLETDWILGIDADQQVTPELRNDIVRVAADGPPAVSGWFVRRKQIFRGRWIRHGGYYPKYLLKLFRRSRVSLNDAELVDHHFHVTGEVGRLESDLIEDNRNEAEIFVWTEKHNRYARLQARQDVAVASESLVGTTPALFGSPDERTMWMKRVWIRLPLFVRPCLYVTYRYVLRLGFLDGKPGFIFHVLQAFWYRLLVDINVDELRQSRARAPGSRTQ